MAYGMAKATDNWRPFLLMLVILPFWTSFLIRVYAWIGILKNEGLLNSLLLWAGRDLRAADHPADHHRGLYRHRLLLPAVHDPADLRQPRAPRPDPDRGRGRSRLHADRRVLEGDRTAGDPGHRRRLLPGVHPRRRRVRDPRPHGRLGHADDRQGRSGPSSSTTATGRWPRPWRSSCCWCWSCRSRCSSATRRRTSRARADGPRLHQGHGDRPDAGLRLPLSADPAAGGLLLQRLQAGHRLGRLLAALVRGRVEQPAAARLGLGHAARRPALLDHRPGAGHHGRRRADAGSPASPAAPSSPA